MVIVPLTCGMSWAELSPGISGMEAGLVALSITGTSFSDSAVPVMVITRFCAPTLP